MRWRKKIDRDVWAICVVSGLLLVVACRGERAPVVSEQERSLVPVHRLIDLRPDSEHDDARSEDARWADVDGEARRTFSKVPCGNAGSFTIPSVPASGTVEHMHEVPKWLQNHPWVVFRAVVAGKRGRGRHGTVAVRGPDDTRDRVRLLLHLPRSFAGQSALVKVKGCRLPPVDERDESVDGVEIPSRAVLRTFIAIEEIAWGVEAGPTVFRVVVTPKSADPVEVVRHRLDPGAIRRDRRWVEVSADLSAFAGRSVQLTFSARRVGAAGGMPPLPLWGEPVVLARRPAARRPNVVLISLDTLRAESVGVYGAERPTTPALDALAARATVFERAMAPFSYTLPSHISMFTGRYHRSHGVRGMFHRLTREYETLAETLATAGYATVAVTDGGYLSAASGLRRGFDLYMERRHRRHDDVRRSPHGPSGVNFSMATDWLWRYGSERPFFLFVHSYHVHGPHSYRGPYAGLFRPEASGADRQARLRAHYEEEIRLADDAVAALMGELDLLGVAADTVVIVTSDHGEEFGEHGGRSHGPHLYDEVMHVPLIVWMPGASGGGRRISQPVSLVDLRPTILELARVSSDETSDGISLVPFLSDAMPPHRTRVVFAEGVTRFHPMNGGLVDVHAAATGTHKCIHGRERVACFDLTTDPDERTPLPEDALPRLREALRAFREGDAMTADLEAKEVEPALAERLRELGYLDATEAQDEAPGTIRE